MEFNWSDPTSYATAAQNWGNTITSIGGTVQGVQASLSAQGVAYPSPQLGAAASNPAPDESIIAKLGAPLWAVISGGVAAVALVIYLIVRK